MQTEASIEQLTQILNLLDLHSFEWSRKDRGLSKDAEYIQDDFPNCCEGKIMTRLLAFSM